VGVRQRFAWSENRLPLVLSPLTEEGRDGG
jgi:hypothetical protein